MEELNMSDKHRWLGAKLYTFKAKDTYYITLKTINLSTIAVQALSLSRTDFEMKLSAPKFVVRLLLVLLIVLNRSSTELICETSIFFSSSVYKRRDSKSFAKNAD